MMLKPLKGCQYGCKRMVHGRHAYACSLTLELVEICSRFKRFLSDNAILALVSLNEESF